MELVKFSESIWYNIIVWNWNVSYLFLRKNDKNKGDSLNIWTILVSNCELFSSLFWSGANWYNDLLINGKRFIVRKFYNLSYITRQYSPPCQLKLCYMIMKCEYGISVRRKDLPFMPHGKHTNLQYYQYSTYKCVICILHDKLHEKHFASYNNI